MRIARLLVIFICLSAAASCEREAESPAPEPAPPPPPAATTEPSLSPGTTTAPSTQPTTELGTTQPSTSAAAADPLASPTSAIAHLFDLMRKQDVDGVRAMMVDPMPAAELRREVAGVAKRLNSGAKWEVVDSNVQDNAALVLFRTTFPDGKEEVSPLVFVNRYDRWKVQLGPLNLKKYTPGEKASMNKVLEWGVKRMGEIRGVPLTMPSTTPVAPPTTPGEAATSGK